MLLDGGMQWSYPLSVFECVCTSGSVAAFGVVVLIDQAVRVTAWAVLAAWAGNSRGVMCISWHAS